MPPTPTKPTRTRSSGGAEKSSVSGAACAGPAAASPEVTAAAPSVAAVAFRKSRRDVESIALSLDVAEMAELKFGPTKNLHSMAELKVRPCVWSAPLDVPAALVVLQEDQRLMGRHLEPGPARQAVNDVVHPDHVIAQFRVQRAVAFVCSRWNLVLLDPPHPLELVVVLPVAAWTGQRRGAGLRLLGEEVPLVESHLERILQLCPFDGAFQHWVK